MTEDPKLNRPINLFEVLTDEYNCLEIEPTLRSEDISQMRTRAEERIGDKDNAGREPQINQELLKEFYLWIHKCKTKRAALCLSGGGIRSGIFALGLIQGLARHNLLNQFHYLSTVSGGGYIGSWLTAWINRHPQGLSGVTRELTQINPVRKIDPEPDPVHYLRQYSNFVFPSKGFLLSGTWTLVATYLRNLYLNWMVFIPLIIAVLTIPRLILAFTLSQSKAFPPWPLISNAFGHESLSLYPRHIVLAGGFVLSSWAIAYIIFNQPGVREELPSNSFWRQRYAQDSFLRYCLLPLVCSTVCFTTYWAWTRNAANYPLIGFLLFGIACVVLGWVVASIVLRRPLREFIRIEFFSLLVGGTVGGFLFWLLSQNRYGQPIVVYRSGKEFPWTAWSDGSEWTWTNWTTEIYSCLAVPFALLAVLVAIFAFVGFSSRSLLIRDEDREWWARLSAWLLIVIVGWASINTLVIFGPIALLSSPALLASVGSLSGLIAVLTASDLQRSAKGDSNDGLAKGTASVLASVASQSQRLLAAIFVAVLIAGFSLATTGIIQLTARVIGPAGWGELLNHVPTHATSSGSEGGFQAYLSYIYPTIEKKTSALTGAKIVHMNILHHTSFFFVLSIALATLYFGLVVSRASNLSLFTLRTEYRNRLIRAFLGPSHDGRRPNLFTGFDPADNFQMHEVHPALLSETDILDPVELANELLTGKSEWLHHLRNRHLSNLQVLPSNKRNSPGLVAALLRDLNWILRTRKLDELLHDIPRNKDSSEAGCPSSRYNQIAFNRSLLHDAFPSLIRPHVSSEPPRLLPVINATLNIVGGSNLAWQKRNTEPFSISPLHSGCFRLGYRQSSEYGGMNGISIGTATAISAADASSNLGFSTKSLVVSLFMRLFKVRSGWWLGNPGMAGNDTFYLNSPRYSIGPVLDEAFGLMDDQNRYVYLTDGGHFENLGLYEMVLRRCHFIIVSDGTPDPEYSFSDLGNAMRKIRIDLGIPIEFPPMPIHAKPPDVGIGQHCSLGRIRYSCIDEGADDGILLYFKPAVYGTEPQDILEYKQRHPGFPQESTADQFFDEAEFESYRMLGSFIMDQVCGGMSNSLDLRDVIQGAGAKLGNETLGKDFASLLDH